MTTFTEARYGLTFGFVPGDSGWGATFNRAVKTVGAMLNSYLLSDTMTNPPTSPADGDTYYIPGGATGAWAGHNGSIGAYQGGAWQFFTPPKGLRAYINSKTGFFWFNGTAWLTEASVTAGVSSVNGETGAVVLAASDIGAATPGNVTTAVNGVANGAFNGGAEGDIVVFGASGWQRISHGTDGQILYTHGAGALPAWGDAPSGGTGGGTGGGGVTAGSTISPASVSAPDDYSGSGTLGSDLLIQAGGGTHGGGNLVLKGGRSDQIPGQVIITGGGGNSAGDPSGNSGGVVISTPNTGQASTGTAGITIKAGHCTWNGSPGNITISAGDQLENGLGFHVAGGRVDITAGRGGYQNGPGGDIHLTPGLKNPAGSGRNGAVVLDNLSSVDPGVAGALWFNNGALCLSGQAAVSSTLAQSVTSGTSANLSFGKAQRTAYIITMSAAATLNVGLGTTNIEQIMTIDILQTGAGFLPTFSTNISWPGGTVPTFNTVTGKVDTVELRVVGSDIIGRLISAARTPIVPTYTGPTPRRFWRIDMTASTYGSYPSLAEVTMASTAGGSNLIGSGTASASAELSSGYAAAKAVDGNNSSWWTGSLPGWWQYDFGFGVTHGVAQFTITCRNDSEDGAHTAPGSFTMQSSDDGTTWHVEGTYTGITWTSGQTQTFNVP